MHCANCGHEDKEDVKYCSECGSEKVIVPSLQIKKKRLLWAPLSIGLGTVALIACLLVIFLLDQATEMPYDEEGNDVAIQTQNEESAEPIESDLAEPNENLNLPPEAMMISIDALAASIREEFSAMQTVEWQPPLHNLPVDHVFVFELEFEFPRFDGDDYIAFYLDSDFTNRMWVDWNTYDNLRDPSIPEGHSRAYASAPFSPYLSLQNTFFDFETGEIISLDGGYDLGRLFEYENNSHWGFARHFYMVQYVDSFGRELHRPKVTIFTLENELEAPKSEFFVTPDGRGGFRWDAVPNADYYLVVGIIQSFEGARVRMTPIAKTYDTSWEHPMRFGTSNSGFRNHDNYRLDFSVIAVNQNTNSPIGNLHNAAEITSRLIHRECFDTEPMATGRIDDVMHYFIPDIANVPSHRSFLMADESVVSRRLTYLFDEAYFYDETGFVFWEGEFNMDFYDEWRAWSRGGWEGEFVADGFRAWPVDATVKIPFIVEESWFYGVVVLEATEGNYQSILEIVRAWDEKATSIGGGRVISTVGEERPEDEPANIPQGDTGQKIIFFPDEQVYANSALSAFLARNLLAVNEWIDLSLFPESADWEYLGEAFFEALYQNPLIMHVSGASMIPGTNILTVHYKEPPETIRRQQNEVRIAVQEIANQLLTPGMSDLEKSLAINDFLVKNVEYDFGALENAEKNDFRFVDDRYNDAFTAYGVLIHGLGVCQGIAAAYTLIADAMNLRSIVVTGLMEGFLPHAWNRVYIDGHWHILDVTNNANELFPNALLHLSDDSARHVLVEDSLFVQDAFVARYRSNDNSMEYFYTNGLVFGIDEIVHALAVRLNEANRAVVRTDFELCDVLFGLIALEVLYVLDATSLYGGHFVGVISMTTTRP